MSYNLIPQNFLNIPSKFFDWDDDLAIHTDGSSGIDLFEDDEFVYVQASLPGVDPDDVEVTFDKGVLWIKGDKKEEEKDKKLKFYRRSTSSFSYRVSVPGEIDLSKEPEAESKHGVTTIKFHKHPQSKPKKISVKKLK